jgi:peptide/nickel transport system permease protein
MTAGGASIRRDYSRLGIRLPRRPPVVVLVAGCVLAAVTVVALFAPLLAPHDPNAVDFAHVFSGPSGLHLLGTDESGRDLLSRLITGSRTSLLGALIVDGVAAVAGSLLAVLSAWIGGWFDLAVGRLVDLLFAFPGLLLAILATAVFGPSLQTVALALALSYVPYTARVVRSEALRQRHLPYIESAWAQGQPSRRIIRRHLLPSLLPLIIAQTTVSFGYATIDVAALSYLGLGVQPPTADWGTMVASGQTNIVTGHPQESLYAGACLVIVVVAFTIIGDALGERARRSERTT